MKEHRWKLMAGSVAALIVLVAVFLLSAGDDRTTLKDPVPSVTGKNRNNITRWDTRHLSEPSADTNRAENGGLSRERSLTGRQGTRTSKGAARQGRGVESPARPLIWPPGIGPEDLPPWMTGRPEDYLEAIEDVRDETPSPDRTEDNNIVLFAAAQPDPVTGYPYSDVVFDPSAKRLYAWFPCDSSAFDGRTKILVKWTQADNADVLFEGMGILDTTLYNYVWLEESYWSPGTYSVEIYGLEEDIPLLAWGSFEVAALDEHKGFAGLYHEPGDEVSQQTFYLDDEIYLKVNYSSTREEQVQLLVRRVADGAIVKGGVVTLVEGYGRNFAVFLTEEPYPFEAGVYILELLSFPEPQYLIGRNVFKVLE